MVEDTLSAGARACPLACPPVRPPAPRAFHPCAIKLYVFVTLRAARPIAPRLRAAGYLHPPPPSRTSAPPAEEENRSRAPDVRRRAPTRLGARAARRTRATRYLVAHRSALNPPPPLRGLRARSPRVRWQSRAFHCVMVLSTRVQWRVRARGSRLRSAGPVATHADINARTGNRLHYFPPS